MKRTRSLAVLAAASLIAATALGQAAAEDAQSTVDARVAAMKEMGGKVSESSQLSGSNPAEARVKLAAAVTIAESIPSHFPSGTADGDPGVTNSRALDKIWSDQAGFKKASATLLAALKAADAALAANDTAGAEAAFADVRKSCGGCHQEFRGPAKN